MKFRYIFYAIIFLQNNQLDSMDKKEKEKSSKQLLAQPPQAPRSDYHSIQMNNPETTLRFDEAQLHEINKNKWRRMGINQGLTWLRNFSLISIIFCCLRNNGGIPIKFN